MNSVGQLERIRWTTSRYSTLHGLNRVVLGIALVAYTLLLGLGMTSWPASALLAGLTAAGLSVVHRYYRRTFGRVTPSSTAVRRQQATVLMILLLVPVVLAGPAVTGWPTESFLIAGALAIVTWALVDRRRSGGMQPGIVVSGVLIVGWGILVAVTGTPAGSLADNHGVNWLLLAAGSGLVIAGILDHAVLVRGLRTTAPAAETR